jgi:prephenate dehydratase
MGSNSHMAALELLAASAAPVEVEIVPCAVSAMVFERLMEAAPGVDAAVLPIENSLHGSVAEHYDLLLNHPVRILRESFLRIRFNLIAFPGIKLEEIKRVLSHPVALAQCRGFLAAHHQLEVLPFYDTAGSVKHVMEMQLRDTAGIAPELAALEYGGEILARDLEDNAANFTRFHLICREDLVGALPPELIPSTVSKMTVAFSVEHRPGTLVQALRLLSEAGVDLTRIESRPVPGRPWEYVFYVEFRFAEVAMAEAALTALGSQCHMVKELGRYMAA